MKSLVLDFVLQLRKSYLYLVHGLPVAHELKKTNIISLQIMQGNETITLAELACLVWSRREPRI